VTDFTVILRAVQSSGISEEFTEGQSIETVAFKPIITADLIKIGGFIV
jgi:hypothetical protein